MSLASRATDIASDSATKAAEVVTALVTQAKQALTAKRSLEETERLLVAKGAVHEWRHELGGSSIRA